MPIAIQLDAAKDPKQAPRVTGNANSFLQQLAKYSSSSRPGTPSFLEQDNKSGNAISKRKERDEKKDTSQGDGFLACVSAPVWHMVKLTKVSLPEQLETTVQEKPSKPTAPARTASATEIPEEISHTDSRENHPHETNAIGIISVQGQSGNANNANFSSAFDLAAKNTGIASVEPKQKDPGIAQVIPAVVSEEKSTFVDSLPEDLRASITSFVVRTPLSLSNHEQYTETKSSDSEAGPSQTDQKQPSVVTVEPKTIADDRVDEARLKEKIQIAKDNSHEIGDVHRREDVLGTPIARPDTGVPVTETASTLKESHGTESKQEFPAGVQGSIAFQQNGTSIKPDRDRTQEVPSEIGHGNTAQEIHELSQGAKNAPVQVSSLSPDNEARNTPKRYETPKRHETVVKTERETRDTKEKHPEILTTPGEQQRSASQNISSSKQSTERGFTEANSLTDFAKPGVPKDSPEQTHGEIVSTGGRLPSTAEPDRAHSRFVQTANLQQQAERAEMHIGLHTSETGKVEVHTFLRDGQTETVIAVEKGDVRQALLNDMPALHSNLREQHIDLARVSVVGCGDTSQNFGGGQTGNGGGHAREQNSAGTSHIAQEIVAERASRSDGAQITDGLSVHV